MIPILFVVGLSLGIPLLAVLVILKKVAREQAIRSFTFPVGLFERLRKTYPTLSLKDCQLVAHGLRQFFLAYQKSGHKFVSMPSQVADELWHEFILYTKQYEQFCAKAFGTFLHHTPAAAMGSGKQSNAGLRRCWWYACKEENINPGNPMRLPLLFALDKKLKIPDGFYYETECSGLRRQNMTGGSASGDSVIIHCGGDFYDTGFDGTLNGAGGDFSFSGGASCGGDSGGGDGGGCGGGGCGGGGCGGGA